MTSVAKQAGKWGSVILAVALFASVAPAQVFVIDVDGTPGAPFTQTVDAANGSVVTAYVVVTGVTEMLGANCDVLYDSSLIELISITEQAGDINFDGIPALPDVLQIVSFFGQPTGTAEVPSYYDREVVFTPGVVALADILSVVSGFGVDTDFWTNNLGVDLTAFGGFRESVEIYDPVAVSNANNMIDDVVAVLLARPEVRADENLWRQFAFTGDAIMAELQFNVVGAAGQTATLSIRDDAEEKPVVLTVDNAMVNPSNPTVVTGQSSTINIQ